MGRRQRLPSRVGEKGELGVHWDTFLQVHFCLVLVPLVMAPTLLQRSLKSLPLCLHSGLHFCLRSVFLCSQ